MRKMRLAGSCLLVSFACAKREAPHPVNAQSTVVPSASATASTAEAAPKVPTSEWAVSADGRVRILGRGVDAVHDHGGPPAHIGSAGFEIHNQRDTALAVSVLGIDWLVGSGCQAPSEVKAHPAFAELRRGSFDEKPGKTAAVPRKSKVELEVGYAWQDAYMVYCDRFATRVHFDVDGERITATAEHRVVRRTPLRRP